MKNKAVFLDRDGTVNVDGSYLYKIEDFHYLDGVKEGLKILQNLGYLLIIITNQSGIARGYYSESDHEKLMNWLIEDLKKSGIVIAAYYYCPHHPDAEIIKFRQNCDCRKPKTGLFKKAIEDFNIDLDKSFLIGDRMRDLELCRQSKAIGFKLYSDRFSKQDNIFQIKGGLLEAAKIIADGEKLQ